MMLTRQHSLVASWIVALVAAGSIACTSASPDSSNPDDSDSNSNNQSSPSSSVAPRQPTTAQTATPTSGLTLVGVTPSSIPVGSAPAGQLVTLTGSGFVSGAQVSIGGRELLAATVTSPTTLTVTIPAADLAAVGNLSLAVVIGSTQSRSNDVSLSVVSGSSAAGFTLDPSSSPPSQSPFGAFLLTVTGSGFDGNSVVVFNGEDIPTRALNATTLTAAVPNSLLMTPGQVNVAVRKAGVLSASVPFTIGSATGAAVCQQGLTCAQFGLSTGQCANLQSGGSLQCGNDGCVQFVSSCSFQFPFGFGF